MLAEEMLIGEQNLARIRNTIAQVENQLAQARGLARQIEDKIEALRGQIASLDPADAEQNNALEKQIELLQQQRQTLKNQAQGGNRVRSFIGEGNRQYLTGLHIGGNRALILLDNSASMLDEAIVNIIRRRNRPDNIKLDSPKWQQALAITDWIVANLPPNTDFQIYTFNETAQAAIPQKTHSWISTSNQNLMARALNSIKTRPPDKGTSLLSAFAVIDQLKPRPENVYLITDGLPTIGAKSTDSSKVTNKQRIEYFNDAYSQLPEDIPFNILLLPMEGDPYAASAFWRIALDTRGAFITPSRDWPK